jgi:hypothetical protein
MKGSGRVAATVAALGGFGLLVSCGPFEFRKQDRENTPPFTFFNTAPRDTTYSNQAFFVWLATDLDSDVVAYQYQLVETDQAYFESAGQNGRVLRSVVPSLESADQDALNNLWSDRTLDNAQTFADLDDGWYEMRARGIDAGGVASDPPARKRFYVFFDDVPPTPIVVTPRPGSQDPACGRIPPVTTWTFWIDATDESRNATTPRRLLQYSYQLRGRRQDTCSTHLTDGFTDWTYFPAGSGAIEVGLLPPTQYTDLQDPECGWDFTLRVRDPAGNVASFVCCITKAFGC